MKLRLRYPALIVLASGLVVAGCGGSDTSTTSSSSTTAAGATGASGAQGPITTSDLPKDQWISAADNICQQTNDAIKQQAQQQFGQQQPSQADLTKFATATVIPQTQSELSQIQALGAPAGDEEQVQALLDAAQQGLDKVKQDPSIAVQKNAGGAFDQADQLATTYGLKVCGSSTG